MTLFEIIILAIIQGITEFLPISSSAHLILPSEILGWNNQGMAFDVAVHLGSLLAVVLFFRQDIVAMTEAWFASVLKKQHSANSRLAWWVIIGTLPAVVFGFMMKPLIEEYARSAAIIAVTTIAFGLLLLFADKTAKQTKKLDKLSLSSVLWIGFSQVLALIPGTSRSGITMTSALMLGFDRESAARFSFLLSIPTILGAGVLATSDLVQAGGVIDWQAMLYGVLFSFVSAYACIYLFLSWISRLGMTPFVIYRLAIGGMLVWFVWF